MEIKEEAEGASADNDIEELRKRKMRHDAENLSDAVFNKETRDHLVRAGTEIILAVDSMVPRDKIPSDVKKHFLAAKRETLLLFRALLDAQLGMIRDLQKPVERPADEVEPGLRKIELE